MKNNLEIGVRIRTIREELCMSRNVLPEEHLRLVYEIVRSIKTFSKK